jgi:uncharacterized protein (TIRG00374 family)
LGVARTAGRLALVAGFAIFAGLIYYIGPSDVARVLAGARYGYVLAAMCSIAAASFIRVYKWSMMRDRMGMDAPLPELAGMFFSSKFWGMVSPMRSGEAVPALLDKGRRAGLLSLILYDRVVESFQTLIVFVCAFIVFYGSFFDAGAGLVLAGIVLVLLLATFLMVRKDAGEFAFSVMERVAGALPAWLGRDTARRALLAVEAGMEEFYRAVGEFFSVGFTFSLLMVTFLAWGFEMGFWLGIFAAAGVDVPVTVSVAAVVVFSMISALAPIPGGLGAGDLGLAMVLGHFGYAAEAGGAILLSRVVTPAYLYGCYLLFSARRT